MGKAKITTFPRREILVKSPSGFLWKNSFWRPWIQTKHFQRNDFETPKMRRYWNVHNCKERFSFSPHGI